MRKPVHWVESFGSRIMSSQGAESYGVVPAADVTIFVVGNDRASGALPIKRVRKGTSFAGSSNTTSGHAPCACENEPSGTRPFCWPLPPRNCGFHMGEVESWSTV